MKKLIVTLASVALLMSSASAFCWPEILYPVLAAREIACKIMVKAVVELAEYKVPAPQITERGNVAYVVSARRCRNLQTEKDYAELVLINETGCFEVTTVEGVENYNFMPVFTETGIGRLDGWEGKIILFDMRKTDKIQKLENRRSEIKNAYDGEDGFYRVNVVGERGENLSFYNTDKEIDVLATPAETLSYHEDGHAIIAISGGEYQGSRLNKIPARVNTLPAGEGNAILQVEEGEVVRVFSFN